MIKNSKKIIIHHSFEEAEQYDKKLLKGLSGEEKIKQALQLMAPYYEATQGLKRVYRVIEQKDLPVSDNWRVGV